MCVGKFKSRIEANADKQKKRIEIDFVNLLPISFCEENFGSNTHNHSPFFVRKVLQLNLLFLGY